jgi:hypothetical protein
MERRAIATDVNPVAYCVTRAKTFAPRRATVMARLLQLEGGYRARDWERKRGDLPEFFNWCYSRKTLGQLLYLRSALRWKETRADAFLAGATLGILHGESAKTSSALSNQMPRTISTKPAYSIRWWRERDSHPPERDCFEAIRNAIAFRYASDPPEGKAQVFCRDMRELAWISDDLMGPIKCVITSPPYFDVTNFEEDQWLRLWFLGGPPVPRAGRISSDDRHSDASRYWNMIGDMWRSLGRVVASRADIVIRIGAKRIRPEALKRGLEVSSMVSGRRVELVHWETSKIRNRQTDAFRPGSVGCSVEVDCHFRMG